MNAAKHTKGPWQVGKPAFGQLHVYSNFTVGDMQCNSGRQAICSVPYEGKKGSFAYHEMFAANARLITAAPELLTALQETVQVLQTFSPEGAAVERARAAISKATGEAT